MKQEKVKNMEKDRKEVIIWIGAGEIGLAIIRRIGTGKQIIVADKSLEKAQNVACLLKNIGFDVVAIMADLSSRSSILSLIDEALKYGEIKCLVNSAGVSPSQASIETILKVDLYGTAVLLEEVGKVIAHGGSGITISSQSGHRLPALSPETDELNGIRGEFYKNMFAQCPASRPGTADEIAHLAELILSEKGAFITGSDFLIDGGATASYFYGPLNPNKNGRNQN